MQQLNKIFLIVIVVALGALGTAVYFFVQYSGSQAQVTQLKDEKTIVETELALLKATDLVKEVEIVALKLTTVEKDLASTKKDLSEVEKARSDLALDLYRLRNGLAKVPAYLSTIDTMEDINADGPSNANVSAVDAKVVSLKDDSVSKQWQIARAGIDIEKKSWMGGEIARAIKIMTQAITKLISQ